MSAISCRYSCRWRGPCTPLLNTLTLGPSLRRSRGTGRSFLEGYVPVRSRMPRSLCSLASVPAFQVPAVRFHTVCLQVGGPSQRDGVAVRDPAVFDDETPCLPGFLLLQSADRGQLLFPDAGIEEQQVVGDTPGFLKYGFTGRFLDKPDEGFPLRGVWSVIMEGGYPVVRTQFQTEVRSALLLGDAFFAVQLFQPRGHIIFLF